MLKPLYIGFEVVCAFIHSTPGPTPNPIARKNVRVRAPHKLASHRCIYPHRPGDNALLWNVLLNPALFTPPVPTRPLRLKRLKTDFLESAMFRCFMAFAHLSQLSPGARAPSRSQLLIEPSHPLHLRPNPRPHYGNHF